MPPFLSHLLGRLVLLQGEVEGGSLGMAKGSVPPSALVTELWLSLSLDGCGAMGLAFGARICFLGFSLRIMFFFFFFVCTMRVEALVSSHLWFS
jgi:hypothetical protein